MSRRVLLATMRNEAPFILEWLAYHRVIGFDRFIIYSNDSNDGTTELLNRLDAEGELEHRFHSPDPEVSVVEQIVTDIETRADLAAGDWLLWIDADEFLNIHAGGGKLDDLIEAVGDRGGACIPWRIFGDSDRRVFTGRFLSAEFDRCAEPGQVDDTVKTLLRFGPDVARLFNHKPVMAPDFWAQGGAFVNGNGAPMGDGPMMTAWRKGQSRSKIDTGETGWQVAQINHYAVRTRPFFHLKRARGRIGRANARGTRYTRDYFLSLNLNEAQDQSILRHDKAVTAEIARLRDDVLPPFDYAGLFPAETYGKIMTLDADTPAAPINPLYTQAHSDQFKEEAERDYVNGRIAEAVIELFAPKRTIDIGCGVGYLMRHLRAAGVEANGVEGEWLTDDKKLNPLEAYQAFDLEQPLPLEGGYDVCMCLEVAEHLEPTRADGFVADLTRMSDRIVFSAAIPGQGGVGHKNEQWQDYWAEKFDANGFDVYDPFRPRFASDPKVFPWFKQNLLVFIKRGAEVPGKLAAPLAPADTAAILPIYHRKVVNRATKQFRRRIGKVQEARKAAEAKAAEALAAAPAIATASTAFPAQTDGPRVLGVTCMKNEAPFILEWIAFHRMIGVTDFVVYTNDCSDGTDLLLDRLDELGIVKHLPNPATILGSSHFQPTALRYTTELPVFAKADYVLSFDVDEFLNINAGDGSIKALLDATGNPDAISLNESLFANDGRETFEPGFVTEHFTMRSTNAPGDWRARRGVKTLWRVGCGLSLRNHRPVAAEGVNYDDLHWVDGSGRPVPEPFMKSTENGFDCRGAYEHAQLNHYPLRSIDSFLVKRDRGDVVIADRTVTLRYWRQRNRSDQEDLTIAAHLPKAKAEYERLMSDAETAKLHNQAIDWHHKRIAELREDPDFAAFRAEIQGV